MKAIHVRIFMVIHLRTKNVRKEIQDILNPFKYKLNKACKSICVHKIHGGKIHAIPKEKKLTKPQNKKLTKPQENMSLRSFLWYYKSHPYKIFLGSTNINMGRPC